jgi:hypothetical protein
MERLVVNGTRAVHVSGFIGQRRGVETTDTAGRFDDESV